MRRRKKNKKALKAQARVPPRKESVAPGVAAVRGDSSAPPKRKWMGAVIVSATATLVASGIAAYTRIFEAKLSIANLPAAVSQLGVSGSPGEARHLVHVNFCVSNQGVRSGNVSSVHVGAVGLPKIPNVDVQDLDRGAYLGVQ